MTIYVTGAAGQVGRLLSSVPGTVGLSRAQLDITDPASIATALASLASDDVVINTAAFTRVDAAQSQQRAAWSLNVAGAANVAAHCAQRSARCIQISTDYVFDVPGMSLRRPLEPDDVGDDQLPRSVYGQTKLAGEKAVMRADPDATIVRTAWVYTGESGGSDFVATMRRMEGERAELAVVDDQTGSPTYARDLAAALLLVAAAPTTRGSVLHATNSGSCTWFDLARAVFIGTDADPARVRPTTTANFPRPAPRPEYSVLSPRSWIDAGLPALRPWRAALDDALARRDR